MFPVAGLGTRFLPATKAMPKEMLTVVDRPVIQHVVDEARAAGIEHFIFVTGRNKGVIEDHFDRQFELEHTLAERGKQTELDQLMRELPGAGQTSFTRQQAPLGLGHAVWCAREIVGDEPFAAAAARRAAPCAGHALPRPDDRPPTMRTAATIIGGGAGAGRRRRINTASSASEDAQGARCSRITQMVEKPQAPARRRRTCTSPAATSCSPRSSPS